MQVSPSPLSTRTRLQDPTNTYTHRHINRHRNIEKRTESMFPEAMKQQFCSLV